jgi:hypothetical protein
MVNSLQVQLVRHVHYSSLHSPYTIFQAWNCILSRLHYLRVSPKSCPSKIPGWEVDEVGFTGVNKVNIDNDMHVSVSISSSGQLYLHVMQRARAFVGFLLCVCCWVHVRGRSLLDS